MAQAQTLENKLIAEAVKACVAHFHESTKDDSWGLSLDDWQQTEKENPASGYINRYFTRSRDEEPLVDTMFNRPGTICVTFLRGRISDVGWYLKPSGIHMYPGEDYIHRDQGSAEIEVEENKPKGYGDWA